MDVGYYIIIFIDSKTEISNRRVQISFMSTIGRNHQCAGKTVFSQD